MLIGSLQLDSYCTEAEREKRLRLRAERDLEELRTQVQDKTNGLHRGENGRTIKLKKQDKKGRGKCVCSR